jgi:opacity protein-like surface antigen
MRRLTGLVVLGAVLGFPATGLAQDAEEEGAQASCPPGAWFCEEDATSEPAEEDLPPDPAGAPGRAERRRPAPAPAVVYAPVGQPPPRVVLAQPVRLEPPPPRPRPRHRRRFGLNLRLEGVMLGDDRDRAEGAGMGGLGVSFRYRPVPHFSLDVGVDALGGTDWEGHERDETALTVSGIVFFNPRNAVQFYLLGGIGGSSAHVYLESDVDAAEHEWSERYSYFGAHLGIGLEFRITQLVSLNLDLVGFMRGRTDDAARTNPEFVDPDTGRTTNSSGGGLFRGGLTFYF